MKKAFLKIFVIAIFVFAFTNSVNAEKLIDYGFEDWVGFNGTSPPAPGYIFTSPSLDTAGWTEHINSTIVTTGGIDCNNNTAYEGNYYQHVQTSSLAGVDNCLGGTAQTTNVRNYIGADYEYPDTGEHNTIHFGDIMTGDTAVIRFMFRVTDDWESLDNDIVDNGGGMKFIRWGIGDHFGDNVMGDSNNILIKLRYDYGEAYPRIGIYNDNDSGMTYGSHSINWQDGEWHAFGMKSVRGGVGEYSVSLYLDDWDMNTPYVTKDTIVPDPGNGRYYRVNLVSNWGGV
jgi:hypothetical protein